MREIYIAFVFLFSTSVFAQKVKVLDKSTGKIVRNVTVFNDLQTVNLTTNSSGIIDISYFKNDEIIVFSHISYAVLRIKSSTLKKSNFIVYLEKQSEQLDEIVLSVFKNAEKTNRIAEQIAVVSSKDIQNLSPQTSADLLASIPGIKVQKSQFGGGSPVIRGMESNRILLVVDGVRMNNAIYRKGHLQSSITVAPNMLDKTEVIFGPSSVIYGSDALGGVIHYYTKTPKLSEENEVKSQLFSRFSTVNQEITTNVSAELSFKNWASFTSVSYSDFGDLKAGKNRSHGFTDWGRVYNYSENSNGNYSESPTVNSDPDLLRNTGYNQTDVLQKFFIPLSKTTDLKINLQYSTSSDIPRFDRLTELKDTTLKFAEWSYGPQQRFLLSTQLFINPNKNWLDNGVLTVAYQDLKESRIQRKFGSLYRSYREENVNVFSVNGDFSVPLTSDKKRILSYGFELAYNDVSSNSFGKTLNISDGDINGFSGDFKVQSRYPDGGSDYLSSAVYIDYRQDINSKSTLNSGIRFTNTRLNAKWIDETFITLEDNDISANNSAVTATIGYVYRPGKNWQLNGVLSSGFRSPNIDDVGRVREKNGFVTIPNIYVKPEFAYNAEVGLQKYFNDRKFRFGANVFYTLVDNYIIRDNVYDSDGNKIFIEFDGEMGEAVSNQNRDSAYITGFTTSYLGKISNTWNTSGFITYTKGRTYDTEEPMSSIPPLFGQFDVNYKNNKIELGADIRFNSKKDIEDFNFREGIDNHDLTPVVDETATSNVDKYYGSPSWMTVGLNGRYTLNDNFSMQARLNNLLDEHYIEFASGVSAPGRNLSLSVVANF
ncbi:TonB-dependent receptor [Polaribacter sp. SA4-10]|uniref:TonB-dependent receptor n=1 Tax=Polaribacter sp. SA4-10 TaxID=754397 RepID=UPI000B3D1ECF|nr:TonB-dependent receptor [Polaribacter sp. SA4-10]ARV07241.1 TonB-dependent receptor [Polaribacter sp. SA4-10]